MNRTYRYELVRKTLSNIDIGIYTTYGIKLTSDGPTFREKAISDISVAEQNVKILVDECNKLELEPCHFFDVVEDFIEQ